MKTPEIVAQDVTVTKGDKVILNKLSFTVQPGKLTGLIGPSGSGKTTLMRSIVGLQLVTGGTLMIGDSPAGSSKFRGRVGYVTQGSAVYDDLTVEQNLVFFAALVSVNKRSVAKVISQVDLVDQSQQLVSTLSGGQRARVSLAIALLGEPDVLILDEPTVGLDPLLRQDLWSLFKKLATGGRTIIVSSHVMDEADRCDDILLLRSGELLWAGSGDDLLSQTKTRSTEAAFLQIVKEG